MKELILTTYGPATLEVRRIVGSRIFVAHERHVFPAGTKTRGGETLKKPFVIPRGAILVPAWDDFEGKTPEQFHRVFAGGLYEALRGATHAIRKYGLREEPGELQILRDISDRLAMDLSSLMHGKLTAKSELAEVRRDLAAQAAKLGRPTDKLKAQAAKKIATASTLEVQHPSGTRSQNLPATVERLRAAKRRIDGRLERVHRIGPRVGFFEQVLAQSIGRIFGDLESLRKNLSVEHFQIQRSFSPRVRDIFAERADRIAERLLPQLDAAPFLKTARMIRVDLAKARAARSQRFALAALGRILVAIRLKEAQRAFEAKVILPFALRQDLGITNEDDFRHTETRLESFAGHIQREIHDEDFVRPVRARVLAAIELILREEFNIELDAKRLKRRLKTVSRMF